VWTSDERDSDTALGEYSGPHQKYGGKPPVRVPLPILVGDADCIANGERPGLPIITNISADCAPISPPPCYAASDLFLDKTDVLNCIFAKISVDIINTAYTSVLAAADEVQTFLGPDAVVTPFDQPSDVVPAGVIAIIDDTALVWITGTTNFNQLAVQAFYFGYGPINQGFYSASGIYEHAAIAIGNELVSAGGGTVGRVVLMGHSFGGAVCMVLAAKMTLAGPDTRQVEILTFGAPKPGDQRLHNIIADIRQNHYANERDPIPFMPPVGITLAALVVLVGPVLAATWRSFVGPPHVQVVTQDGKIEDTAADLRPDDSLYILGQVMAQTLQTPKFRDHATDWYSYYLCNACSCVPRPCVKPGEDRIAFDLEIDALEVVYDGMPTIFTYSSKSNDNGLTDWYWREGPIVRAVIQTTEPYPSVYEDVNLYFLGGPDIEHGVEFEWVFAANLDVIHLGLTTTAPPPVVAAQAPHTVTFVSLGHVRITPILL